MKTPYVRLASQRQDDWLIGEPAIALRPYQSKLVQDVLNHWCSGTLRVLAQLPTGGGKTLIFCAIASEFVARGEQVLILAHKEELILQAKDKIEAVCGVSAGIIKAGYPEDRDALIQVASVQTLARRNTWFNPSLIITDEAHHAAADSYMSIYRQFSKAYQLGVTATPQRLDGKGLSGQFDALICGVSLSELMDQGHLSNYRLFAPAAAIDTSGVKDTAGDYNAAQLKRAAATAQVMGAVVPAWREFAPGRQTVEFCVDREHSKAVTKMFQDAGIVAVHLDGETPTNERRDILRAFAQKEITVLSNCGIVSEGLDIPGIEAVQILRPTKSVAMYLQQIGRALRPSPGKEHAIIIDHTTNWIHHGLPDEHREWSLDGSVKRSGRTIERSPSGEVVEREPITVDTQVQLAEVLRKPVDMRLIAKLDDLMRQQQLCHYKPAWVAFRFLELKPGLEELRICARRLGYSPGWAWHKSQELNGGAA